MKRPREVIQPRCGAIFAIAGAIISVVAAPSAVARSEYPYCAVSRGANIDYQNCSYATFAAWLEEIRGLGATTGRMRAMCRRQALLSGIAGIRAGCGKRALAGQCTRYAASGRRALPFSVQAPAASVP
jgi:hypothetical protein